MPERRGRVGQSLSMVLMLVVMAAFAIGLGVLMGRYAFGLLTSGPGGDEAAQGTNQVAPAGSHGDAESALPAQPGGVAPEAASSGAGGTGAVAPGEAEQAAQVPPVTAGQVLYRVQVGEFDDRTGAEALARELGGAGYPGFVTGGAPYRVQVGAFAEKVNAERLAAEIEARGYSVVVVQ
ncbi:MAG: SPOR domain-containing protein [Clostridia bacterium]